MKARPKYRVGQVVRIATDFYNGGIKVGEKYQLITAIEPWGDTSFGGFCLTFANHDKCHEKWVRKLSKREAGA